MPGNRSSQGLAKDCLRMIVECCLVYSLFPCPGENASDRFAGLEYSGEDWASRMQHKITDNQNDNADKYR